MKAIWLVLFTFACSPSIAHSGVSAIIAPGANLEKLAGDFKFTEVPAVDANSNVYFTDQPNDRILKWSVDGNPDIS